MTAPAAAFPAMPPTMAPPAAPRARLAEPWFSVSESGSVAESGSAAEPTAVGTVSIAGAWSPMWSSLTLAAPAQSRRVPLQSIQPLVSVSLASFQVPLFRYAIACRRGLKMTDPPVRRQDGFLNDSCTEGVRIPFPSTCTENGSSI